MADDMKALPAVYAAIAAVMEDVGHEGIAKDRRNESQKYSFRGIDDVYNALAPILAKHHLIIVPRVLSREKTERVSMKDDGRGNVKESVLFYVVVHVEFDIICATDGSKHVASTWGEAMDSGDKATNKAMSAAYKYMAMQTFCIPTEGDNDADASTPDEVRPNAGSSQAPARTQQATGADPSPRSAPVQRTMSKADSREEFKTIDYEMRACKSSDELIEWGRLNIKRIQLQDKSFQADLRKAMRELLDGFRYLEKQRADADNAFNEEIPA